MQNSDYTLTITLADETTVTTSPVRGATGAKGDKGTDGRAITSVAKISTSGLVDTYKISFSDKTSTNFTIANGSSIKSITKTGTSGLTDTYTVTLTDNTTSTFTVKNGNGIASITLQSGTHAAGTTDTYKITFTNGEYTTFSVYNGMNGSGSVVSVNGQDPDVNGNVSLTGDDIPVSATDDTTVPEAIAAKQTATNDLTAEETLADGDYFPFYDVSVPASRKTPWSNIVAKIRSSLFGTLNGFLKSNGSGTLSAVSAVPVANGGTGATTAAAARTNLNVLSNANGAVVTANLSEKCVTAAKLADDVTPAAIGALPLSGGTMTGRLTNTYASGSGIEITHTVTGADCGLSINKASSDKSGAMFVGVGDSGKAGIYSGTIGKWIFYNDGTSTYIDGEIYHKIYVGTSATPPSTWQPGDIYLQYQ